MRLTRKIPEPRFTLQDLLDPPECILQTDLCEYLKALDGLESARLEVETLGSLIIEKFTLSLPVQFGVLKARVVEGTLDVAWGRD